MRKIAPLMLALALVVAACGDDDGADDTTATTTGDTTATTQAATTTTAAPTTTAAAELSEAEAFIAASADRVGEYTGQWDNATFGSTGALYINVLEANPGTINNVLIQVDVDGSAFGAEDPELFVIEMWVENDEIQTGFSDFLGDFTFETTADGSFTVVANPPLLGGMTLEIDGTIDGDGFGGTYVIPGLADGTWNAAPA
jgi:hypothetical protein